MPPAASSPDARIPRAPAPPHLPRPIAPRLRLAVAVCAAALACASALALAPAAAAAGEGLGLDLLGIEVGVPIGGIDALDGTDLGVPGVGGFNYQADPDPQPAPAPAAPTEDATPASHAADAPAAGNDGDARPDGAGATSGDATGADPAGAPPLDATSDEGADGRASGAGIAPPPTSTADLALRVLLVALLVVVVLLVALRIGEWATGRDEARRKARSARTIANLDAQKRAVDKARAAVDAHRRATAPRKGAAPGPAPAPGATAPTTSARPAKRDDPRDVPESPPAPAPARGPRPGHRARRIVRGAGEVA